MEKAWKAFFNTLLCIILFVLIVDGPIHSKTINTVILEKTTFSNEFYDMNMTDNNNDNTYQNNYKSKHIKKKNIDRERVNFLILGVEGELRTDTIIFVSFDIETKELDMISIPRDTYFREKGYERGDQKKINAAYGRKKEKGSMKTIEKILGVPIHHYVSVDFKGVEEIVDIIGGVEVNAPCDMEVGGIKISKGSQTLNGEQAIDFVRFRKKYPNGDLGRVEVQQQFVKSAIKKSLGLNLPRVIKKSFKYIKTDMTLKDILYYGLQARSVKIDKISMQILPGTPKYKEVGGIWWSYYFYDQSKTKEMMKEIYNIRYINEIRTKKLMLE